MIKILDLKKSQIQLVAKSSSGINVVCFCMIFFLYQTSLLEFTLMDNFGYFTSLYISRDD